MATKIRIKIKDAKFLHFLSKLMMMLGLFLFFIWMLGFAMLVGFGSFQWERNKDWRSCWDVESMGRITIFSAPKPLKNGSDLVGQRQELAVRSWLALSPDVDVVLFGHHHSIFAFAAKLGPRVAVESEIDFTFLDTPFFHSMVARSQTMPGISIFVDPEIILLPNILTTLCVTSTLNHDWFLVSISTYISYFPYHLDDGGNYWLEYDGDKVNIEKLQDFVVQEQEHRNGSGRLIIAWNSGDLSLHAGVLPPFHYMQGLHNEWLLNEVLSSEFRFVFDASEVISSFYPEQLAEWSHEFRMTNGNVDGRDWEYRGNCEQALLYGSICCQPKNISNNIAKLVKHSGRYVFINPEKDILYSVQGFHGHAYQHLKLVPGQKQGILQLFPRFQLITQEEKLIATGGSDKLDTVSTTCMKLCKDLSVRSSHLHFPYSLESLLQLVADQNKSVVLAVAGDNYKDMLMNWVCRLRHLLVTNFIVCALDIETYKFSILQGLPVFKDPLAPSNISFDDCHFGTECFQRVTKVKSRIVLQILKLGYNVLLSDVDVYWFENPLPFLYSFGSATLVAQSDEYNETVPINLPRRLNSGFYFVHSDSPTIAAIEKVVKHASTSDLSEQPSFYDVLCGEGGLYRIGDNQCLEPSTNLTVHFLDRNRFPNGAYKGLWEKHNVTSACVKQGCIVLHNNWISGRKRKLERQVRSGLWVYDTSSRMCVQSWQRVHFTSYF
ncbi:Fucosylgalactoside 3-alpha-galactosyltransferase protein [Dioscorea alata]|uniref:Fucosylgalactoside 3-alpha-galactosyltransferase protein n=2 Tax=Dioscorea alata TaxID=55571 RepID=A0ACB7W9U9_DIOAL|nr:Fucosylgalactoside 3-alpha-galactosyltransferase protein [Dioscorea alata]KAH7684881.1 Fucosylgalactoside 3-alpha-galactosyltransferase protein [Dioscorea alata]